MTEVQAGIEPTRVDDLGNLKSEDFTCSFCKKIVWKAVICKNCEALFCSVCVPKAFGILPEHCVNGCVTFVEHRCPRFITEQLARLKIRCVNQSNGCSEVSR
jgi:hypothetical protein